MGHGPRAQRAILLEGTNVSDLFRPHPAAPDPERSPLSWTSRTSQVSISQTEWVRLARELIVNTLFEKSGLQLKLTLSKEEDKVRRAGDRSLKDYGHVLVFATVPRAGSRVARVPPGVAAKVSCPEPEAGTAGVLRAAGGTRWTTGLLDVMLVVPSPEAGPQEESTWCTRGVLAMEKQAGRPFARH